MKMEPKRSQTDHFRSPVPLFFSVDSKSSSRRTVGGDADRDKTNHSAAEGRRRSRFATHAGQAEPLQQLEVADSPRYGFESEMCQSALLVLSRTFGMKLGKLQDGSCGSLLAENQEV